MAGKENVVCREAGTTSSGGTEEARMHTSIPIGSNASETRFNLLKGTNRSQTIQKVLSFLRDKFVEHYEPSVVSFGPIHHRNPNYQSGEKYKQTLMEDFVSDSGKELNVVREQIEKIINQLKNCFDKEVTRGYNDVDLANLLCKDGCAILQYICVTPTHQIRIDFFAQDILLLENQIPYKVLKELMQLSEKKEDLEKSIAAFINESVMVRGDNLPSQANPQRDVHGDHVHLLGFLRTSLLGRSQAGTPNERRDLPSFPKVRELKAAGIHLRRSSDSSLSNISFRRRFHLLGRLYLPPITVNHSARLKFFNLVAYEMLLQNDRGVMSYLFFLNLLINDAQDIKELRDAKVLYNSLGSDTELQNLFSDICWKLPVDPDTYYAYIKEKIQEYYGTLMSKMLQFYHDYIGQPSWPLFTFLGVLLGLLFSGTQTWFTVKTWFSVSPASQSHS